MSADVNRVAAALRVSIGTLHRRLRQTQVDGDLSLPERSALARLDRDGPSTAAALARLERISPQSMGATLAALQARGLVARELDPADGRRISLSISPQGRQLVHDRRNARTEQLAAALAVEFTPVELERLYVAAVLLERLAQRI